MGKSIVSVRATCAVVVTGIALLAAAGCGGGSKHRSTVAQTAIPASARAQPGGTDQSGAIVARVGTIPITQSAVESRIRMEVQAEAPSERILPVPPRYESCVSRLSEAAGSAKGSTVPTHARLVGRCQRLYTKLLTKVLGQVISNEWVIGEAAEEELGPTETQVRQRLEHLKAVQFGSDASFRKFLSESGENIPDLLFNIKQQLASNLIRGAINKAVAPVTESTVVNYYAQHRHEFFVKEQRDLGLVRTKNLSTALKIKEQLASGTSFQTVAARLANSQPIYTVHGLLKNLEPGVYSEKNINDAIFSARPQVVSGPVRLDLRPGFHFKSARDIQNINGYYVFKVLSVRPAHVKPLSEVKQHLTRTLPEILRQLAVAAFIKRWRAKWRSRTNCMRGYVIKKCQEFAPRPGEPAEDPYTLA